MRNLLIKKISDKSAESLCSNITVDEIKTAMFSINGDKSPYPDGLCSYFFYHSWNLVANEMDVREFASDVLGFQTGILPVRYLGVPLVSSKI
ncbi:hypothetical protein LINPERPRIM_LOCUS25470, partial [Linum perenne]